MRLKRNYVMLKEECIIYRTTQKTHFIKGNFENIWSFTSSISSVNVCQTCIICEFVEVFWGHTWWRTWWEKLFFCRVLVKKSNRLYGTKHCLKLDSHLPKINYFICLIKSPLKILNNVFSFILKPVFVLKIIKIISWIFWS